MKSSAYFIIPLPDVSVLVVDLIMEKHLLGA
jgi:hypothetical protein